MGGIAPCLVPNARGGNPGFPDSGKEMSSGSAAAAAILPATGTTTAPKSSDSSIAGVSASAGDIGSGTVNAEFKNSDVVGRIGDSDIKVEDVREVIQSLNPEERAQYADDHALLAQAVRAILVERLVRADADSKQWDQQPFVKAHLERVREKTLTEMYLDSVSKPADDYPSDAEMRKAYEDAKPLLMIPHTFDVAQIFIKVPLEADKAVAEKAQAKLDDTIKRLQQPDADFGAVARIESDETQSASRGGDMGWVSDKKMPERIRVAVLTLGKNKISDPIRLNDGWHIVKVIDFKDISPVAYEDVKVNIAKKLRVERARQNLQDYIHNLLQKSPVSVNEDAVAKLLPKPAK